MGWKPLIHVSFWPPWIKIKDISSSLYYTQNLCFIIFLLLTLIKPLFYFVSCHVIKLSSFGLNCFNEINGLKEVHLQEKAMIIFPHSETNKIKSNCVNNNTNNNYASNNKNNNCYFWLSESRNKKKYVFSTNSVLPIPITFQPIVVNLWYFKLWIMLDQII